MVISSETSEYLRPMKRLIEKIVFSGFVTCCRRAGAPTSRWPSLVNATTDGVVRPPSAFVITVGSPPSSTAMHEFVVPRSMPIVFAIVLFASLSGNLSPMVTDLDGSRKRAYARGVVERRDVEAALEARRELGKDYEPEIVEAFLAKIEHRL